MRNKKIVLKALFAVIFFLCGTLFSLAQKIKNDVQNKTISFGNDKLSMVLDYKGKATISSLIVNGQKVIDGGIFSEVHTSDTTYTTKELLSQPRLKVTGKTIRLQKIKYGDKTHPIIETWVFTITNKEIRFTVDRTLSAALAVEEAAMPSFQFNNINTWEGAFMGHGGLAWFYLFNERLATYGVHTSSSEFWNSKSGNGLSVSVDAPGKEVAMRYTRTAEDKLAYAITVSDKEMLPRFDEGTNRRRFIRQRTDVWAPFKIAAGKSSQTIILSYFNFADKYGRGKFVGLDGDQVSAVLNTIARIGVIDKNHFGGNSWHTPYGPICLHEQYIAQLGLGINDEKYLKGYQDCLDFYRDNAIKPDGRVWARWAYNNVDIMPGQVTDKGFYEAQWGFLLDANPDFVTNVVELYDQTGNKTWLKKHQQSCEKALDWIINRDSDGDGLVEMMTDSLTEKRGSDWIDIIWASYENAFVNAKLYLALTKWADAEQQLNNTDRAKSYAAFAVKLKNSFNKSTANGGFWDEEKKCYVHWLDKDGSVHGRNMVTPVNFMAIAYGICDDKNRSKMILDTIETQMEKENLFFWPLCMTTYAVGEGKDNQFPFPEYENGDIFLSWGSVAVRAYADYKPELALKYVKNVMARHSQDGLAYQRYGRLQQDGRGDDILSGNSLSVIGLYQAIYGINPMYNRFYLNPHITQELAGTELIYRYRGQNLKVNLNMNLYCVANDNFKITATKDFGFYAVNKTLSFFDGDKAIPAITIRTKGNKLNLKIEETNTNEIAWMQTSPDNVSAKLHYTLNDLQPNAAYTIFVNGKKLKPAKANAAGTLFFHYKTSKEADNFFIKRNYRTYWKGGIF